MNPTIQLWRSGFVNRWHSHHSHALRNSQDTTGGHGYRVALLLKSLNPEADANLILFALTHDAQESVTGDIPHGMKRHYMFNVFLKEQERDAADEMELPVVDEDDEIWIKLCDKLDAYLWVMSVEPSLIDTPDWDDEYERIMQMAEELGVEDAVRGLVKSLSVR